MPTAFQLAVSVSVVKRAEITQSFQPPGGVVAGDEVADRSSDLGRGAEGSAPDRRFLEGPKEPLDDAIPCGGAGRRSSAPCPSG